MKRKVIIMAGGRGERFWPVSTPDRPKQFISLTGEGTLIQQTAFRLAQIFPCRDIYVVTSEAHLGLAQAQLPQLPAGNFIVEPVGRDTAPCIGLAAVWLERVDPDTVMLVVPADHYIPNQEHFCAHAEAAMDQAVHSGGLVTLGIRPDRAETGYGYIELGDRVWSSPVSMPVHKARRFVEKPDKAKAESYLATGNFLWNSGIFAWSVAAIRKEIARLLPELHAGLQEIAAAETETEFMARVKRLFPTLPKISIDYGVLERCDQVYAIPSHFTWDDLGSWTAIARLRKPDLQGNVVTGSVLLTEDCQNLVVQSNGRLVALLGVSNLIVVQTDEALLICARDREQDIRLLAAKAQDALRLGNASQ